MKVRDMFTEEFSNLVGDIDVYQDCLDLDGVAFDGAFLTEEGKQKWASVLDLEIEGGHCWGYPCIWVKVDGLPNDTKLAKKVNELFWAAAGYCTEEEWNKWFKYSE